MTKINFDAALKDLYYVIGIVVRNYECQVIHVVANKVLSMDPLLRKALVAIYVVNLAFEVGWNYCLFEGDSQIVISAINSSQFTTYSNIKECIYEARSKLACFCGAFVSKISREINL